MPARDNDLAKNRDDELKPGAPPRHASDSNPSSRSTRNPKTATDPATGAPQPGAPRPAPARR
jgi:hypothetical protein